MAAHKKRLGGNPRRFSLSSISPDFNFPGVGWTSELVYQPHVFGTRALRASAFLVLDFLALLQAVEITFDGRVMEEDIASFTFDKAKAFVSQLLDRTLRHLNISQHAAPIRNVWVAVLRNPKRKQSFFGKVATAVPIM